MLSNYAKVSSYLAFRVMLFCLNRSLDPNWMRWMIFGGHQSKKGAYKMILESFREDPNIHVFTVDDGEKHINDFNEASRELHMQDRTHAVLSPRIRFYTKCQLQEHVDAVFGASGNEPTMVSRFGKGGECGWMSVVPRGFAYFREAMMGVQTELSKEAIIARHRKSLEEMHERVWPGEPKTTDRLFLLFESLTPP